MYHLRAAVVLSISHDLYSLRDSRRRYREFKQSRFMLSAKFKRESGERIAFLGSGFGQIFNRLYKRHLAIQI